MNKYILAGILSLVLVTTSCSDYFDQVPDDRLSMNEVFKTRDGALGYLAGVYTYLPDEFNQRQVHETSLYRTPGPWTAASDEAEYVSSGNKAKLINNNTMSATEETMVKTRWKSWFSGVRESFVFTRYIDQTPTDQVNPSEKQQWKAEAKALRAIYFFYLVRTYGPVPLLQKEYEQGTPTDELQLPRSTVDECFNYIVAQLKEAQKEGLLDNASSDAVSGLGRIDKAIAQAFIIEALTYRASWLFNGECNYYANLANEDGTKLFPAVPDQQTIKTNWQKVVTECQAFLTTYGSRYQLMYTNKDGKDVTDTDASGYDPYESYRRAVRTPRSEINNNREMIFYRIDNSAGTMQYDRMPNDRRISDTNYKGGSLLGATQEQVDAYFMANGMSPILGYKADGVTPIYNEEAGYVEDGMSKEAYKSSTGQVYAPLGTRMMYVNREPRFYADITFNGQKWFEGTNGGNVSDFYYSGDCGKKGGVNDYTSTGYLVRKCMGAGNRSQSLVCILLRLPNIYFNYMEALCHTDPTHSDIWKYMNQIRKRAGIPMYGEGTNALPRPSNKDDIMELIRKEKRVELSFENCRYFDVRRWGLANEYFNRPIHGMNINGDGEDFFIRSQVVERKFDRQYFFPIPQGEIDVDKNLVQNPGY
ncbi:RagB/SusD family nutrient uptake outer membrane protein [Bacteroides sp. 224]|uniref:RagB/SusD family nutrient uptake outer membrane protein n=1 Tax=Bacteroides sp. 224 TaxID=2302936 RepID=UPI0013D76621|nr:RagB/SusD family nutrient uptake outer membrane protein [Bacteroides sp. 224]NDV63718.1 RagB/SusD family nutrient uptake outer membrane protein [Bacteroides sp. 224]